MGLDLWFRQDVARILASTWETMQATAEATRQGTVSEPEDRLAQAYAQGFRDALRAVGLAFGLAGSGGAVHGRSDVVAGERIRGHIHRSGEGRMPEVD